MKYLPFAALLLITTVANAQVPDLTLKVNPAEADTIWRGLRKLPVEDVEALMAKIREQVTTQTTPKADANGNPAEKK